MIEPFKESTTALLLKALTCWEIQFTDFYSYIGFWGTPVTAIVMNKARHVA